MSNSAERHDRSSISTPSDLDDRESHRKPASALQANKRWYYSEKGQANKAQLAERRRIEYQLNKAVRKAEEDLKTDKIAGLCSGEIDRRQAVLDAATLAREQDKAQRPKPGRKSIQPKGTALEEAKRQRTLRRERYIRKREQAKAGLGQQQQEQEERGGGEASNT
jgi:hypothetical protein